LCACFKIARQRSLALVCPTIGAVAPLSVLRNGSAFMAEFKSDIAIARAAKKKPILEIGAKLGIPADQLVPYGHDKAKVSAEFIKSIQNNKDGKLILVTAINPTPAGEGKTTTTVGLGDGLNRIGKKAIVCIREASLGPNFGMKGGAAGGGYAQVVPMDDMNLHFTGDFHAITTAHNLLSALIDNHIYWGNELGIDTRRVAWRRVMDMNDRALRQIVCSLGGVANGHVEAVLPRHTLRRAAEAEHHVPQVAVVHVHRPPPAHAARRRVCRGRTGSTSPWPPR
jgi:hypothetical protein